jgi:hypothetical protein
MQNESRRRQICSQAGSVLADNHIQVQVEPALV